MGMSSVLLSLILTGVSFLPTNAQATQSICDRTAAVRDKILSESGASNCAAVTSSQLASVSRLRLANSSITSLKSGDFAGCPGSADWNSTGTSSTRCRQTSFTVLDSLNWLTLEGGALTSLPAGAFSGLAELKHLDLSNNSLGSIPGDAFSGATAIDRLLLNGNSLSSLPDGCPNRPPSTAWATRTAASTLGTCAPGSSAASGVRRAVVEPPRSDRMIEYDLRFLISASTDLNWPQGPRDERGRRCWDASRKPSTGSSFSEEGFL